MSFDAFEPETRVYGGAMDGVELVTNLGIMGPYRIDPILNVLAASPAEPPTIAATPLAEGSALAQHSVGGAPVTEVPVIDEQMVEGSDTVVTVENQLAATALDEPIK